MGIIRLTLLTCVLLGLGMMYFGRDEDLPEDRIGREPGPEPVVAEIPLEDTTQIIETADVEPEPEPIPDPDPAPQTAPEPTQQAEVEPEPEPEPASETAEPEAPILYVTGTRVNMRSGPSTAFAVVAALTLGMAVDDLGDAGGGWRSIRSIETGERGYMADRFLSSDAP